MTSNLMKTVRDLVRLSALRRTVLLDTAAEAAFGRLTSLASKTLRAPVALVSLVDDEHQTLKSPVGLPEASASWRETRLPYVFCQHVAASGEPLAVVDAREYPLFKHREGFLEAGMIAVAGVPLLSSEAHVLGAVCVIDRLPRAWTDEDMDLLHDLASTAMTEIELRHDLAGRRQAEAARRESETRNRSLLDAIPDLMLRISRDGTVLDYVSSKDEDGAAPPHEFLGRSLSEAMPPELAQQFMHFVGRALETDDIPIFEYHLPAPWTAGGATARDYEARLVASGKDEVVALVRDFTERKRAEEELRAQKELLENLVAVARATAERPTLEATLQNLLNVAATLTAAAYASLFLLDDAGRVTHALLMRDQTELSQQAARVSQVLDRGLAGWIVRQRQAALIADTQPDDRWLTLPDERYTARSVLAVPILSGPAVAGILSLTHGQPNHFNEEHLNLMQAAADQMALAVRNAQIFDAQRRTAERQTTLYEVLRAVERQLDPDEVARAAVESITQFTAWPNVSIAALDEDRQHLVFRADSAMGRRATEISLPIGRGVIGRAFATGRTQLVPDVSADADYVVGPPGTRSELAVPLSRGPKILGVLNVESDQLDAFDADDVALAESLAEAVALALDNAHLHADTRQYLDDLSVLYTVTQMTGQSLVLEEILQSALESTLTSLGFDTGVVMLADAAEGGLRPAVNRGPPALVEAGGCCEPGQALCDQPYRDGVVLIVSDAEREAQLDVSRLMAQGFRAYAGIPLLHQNQTLGTLCLFARHPLTPASNFPALLKAIGHQVATAVTNARLYQAIADGHSRLQALITSSRDGVVLVDLDGRVRVVNAPALQLLRLPGQPADWLNRSLAEALSTLRRNAPAFVRAALAEMRRLRTGDEPPGEGEAEVGARVIRWANLPVLAGPAARGRLLALHDVTEERLLEKMRDDLTHTMVHDLHNPLASIRGMLDVLEMDLAGGLSPYQGEVLRVARQSTQQMVDLVDAILDVSRLESRQMPLIREPVSLRKLVAETLELQAPLAAEKNLRLDNDVPTDLPPAVADAGLIRRVAQNLVGNAIKFTPSGGAIQVRAEVQAEPARLQVAVSDTGPGIPADIQGRLFQKFVTGRHPRRGSGLGLAFCRLAIEAHGGRIWVETEPGEGAAFYFTLPVEE